MSPSKTLDQLSPSPQPWMDPRCFCEIVHPDSGFGYWKKDELIPCTPDELIAAVSTDKNDEIKLVCTPLSSRLVACEEVEFLENALRDRGKLSASQGFVVPLATFIVFVAIAVAMAFSQPEAILPLLFMGLAFGGITAIDKYREMNYWKTVAKVHTADAVANGRYLAWISEQKDRSIWLLPTLGLIVGIVQVLIGRDASIQAAGLVKNAIWQGEVWRAVTAAFLHVGFWHWWGNWLAFIGFAHLIAALTHRAFIPITFITSAMIASLFSLLGSSVTSVGASGGILGLLGFLLYVCYSRRALLPKVLSRTLMELLAYTLFLGVLGFQIVDNWAHLGGLAAGLALGALLLTRSDKQIPFKTGSGLRIAYWVATLAVSAAALAAVIAIWNARKF